MKIANKIILPFLLFTAVLIAFFIFYSYRSLRNALFVDQFYTTQEAVISEARTHLNASHFEHPHSDESQDHFRGFIEGVADSATARVTVWNLEPRALASDLYSVVGQVSHQHSGLEEVLQTGRPVYSYEKEDTDIPKQTDVGKFLDIYIPVSFDGKVVGVVEVHSVVGAVLQPIERQMGMMVLALLLGATWLIGVILVVARLFITRPLRKVNAFVAAMERGEFNATVDIRSHDEMGHLGKQLNRMAVGLKRLRELQNEFVYIASHELRTPVTAIGGYLELMQTEEQGTLSDKMRHWLLGIGSANQRLHELVNDILQIARSEAGKLTIAVVPCDLRQVVRDIAAEQHAAAFVRGVSIAYDDSAALPLVQADPGKLKEVLANLVSNAVKYSPEGTAVKLYHELRNGRVVTHVRDAGFGIPADEQKQVFQKFFRSEDRRVRAVNGTGLGLFITRQLVEKMGGKIWFRSKLGGGSTFSFSLRPSAK